MQQQMVGTGAHVRHSAVLSMCLIGVGCMALSWLPVMPLSNAHLAGLSQSSSPPPTVPQIKNKMEALMLKQEHAAAHASFVWQSTCCGLSPG